MSDHKSSLFNVNPHLICILCSGYLIDATTIVECLHTFCKSCIVRYFESSKFCPVCDVQVHKTDPLLSIRPDSMLQKLVYKLVPKLHHKEMWRRKKFYATNTKFRPVCLEDAGCDIGRKYLLPGDVVCLALRPITDPDKSNEEVNVRYFKIPANVHISQLVKLIKCKFDLPLQHPVSVYADPLQNEPLSDSISLVDVACIKSWLRKQLMVLYYKIWFSKKIKFDPAIASLPGIAHRKKQLNRIPNKQETKPPVGEPIQKKQLPKIAPAPPKYSSGELGRIPQPCKTAAGFGFNSTTLDNSLAYNTILPLNTNPADVIALNPYSFQQDATVNNFGLSLLPLCTPPVMPQNNLLNSFAVAGTVLPMGISFGTNLICPSLTNPVINQNITNIDLSSVPVANSPLKKFVVPSSCIQTSVVNSIDALPISSVIKTEIDCKEGSVSRTIKVDPTNPQDREVHLTISETGVVSFKSDGKAPDIEALIKPIEKEACELLSQIETNNLVDSEDSKESDVLDGSAKLSKIKKEISLIIDNLMENNEGTVVHSDQQPIVMNKLNIIEPEATNRVELDVTDPAKVKKLKSGSVLSINVSDDKKSVSEGPVVETISEISNTNQAPSTTSRPKVKVNIKTAKPPEVQTKYKMKKSQAIGYKTLKCSPRSWNPVIPRDQILRNSNKDRTTNRFFKSRNTSLQNNSPLNSLSAECRYIEPSTVNSSLDIPAISLSPVKNSHNLPLTTHLVSSHAKEAVENASKDSHQEENNATVLTSIGRKHGIPTLRDEYSAANNNNTVGTCCSDDKILYHINKALNKKQCDAPPKLLHVKNESVNSPLKVPDVRKDKPKPYEENKRKSSVPKKTIRLPSQSGATPENNSSEKVTKAKSPLKGSPKAAECLPSVSATPSVDAYKELCTLQALSSLFTPSPSLKEAYKACLPLNLTNGFEKYGLSKGFPPPDMSGSTPYMSGLCGNMLQNFLLQANSMTAQDAMTLLANQENLTSNILGMNFPNSSLLNSSYIGLASTSSQAINNDNSLVSSWFRSMENRHSLLSASSPSVTTPSNIVSPGSNFSSSAKGMLPGMKEKRDSSKSYKTFQKDVGPKSSPNYSQNSPKVSPSLGTPIKPKGTASITFSDASVANNRVGAEVGGVNRVKTVELSNNSGNRNAADVDLLYPKVITPNKAELQCHIPKSTLLHSPELSTDANIKDKQMDTTDVSNSREILIAKPPAAKLDACMTEKNVQSARKSHGLYLDTKHSSKLSPKISPESIPIGSSKLSPKRSSNSIPINASKSSPPILSDSIPIGSSKLSPKISSNSILINASKSSPTILSDSLPIGSSKSSPTILSDSIPIGSSKSSPKRSSNSIPINASKSSPTISSDSIPIGSSKSSPKRSSESITIGSSQSSPKRSLQSIPILSSQSSPKRSSESIPIGSSQSSPKISSQSIEIGFSKSNPKRSFETVPIDSSKLSPKRSSEAIIMGTAESVLKPSQESTLKLSADSTLIPSPESTLKPSPESTLKKPGPESIVKESSEMNLKGSSESILKTCPGTNVEKLSELIGKSSSESLQKCSTPLSGINVYRSSEFNANQASELNVNRSSEFNANQASELNINRSSELTVNWSSELNVKHSSELKVKCSSDLKVNSHLNVKHYSDSSVITSSESNLQSAESEVVLSSKSNGTDSPESIETLYSKSIEKDYSKSSEKNSSKSSEKDSSKSSEKDSSKSSEKDSSTSNEKGSLKSGKKCFSETNVIASSKSNQEPPVSHLIGPFSRKDITGELSAHESAGLLEKKISSQEKHITEVINYLDAKLSSECNLDPERPKDINSITTDKDCSETKSLTEPNTSSEEIIHNKSESHSKSDLKNINSDFQKIFSLCPPSKCVEDFYSRIPNPILPESRKELENKDTSQCTSENMPICSTPIKAAEIRREGSTCITAASDFEESNITTDTSKEPAEESFSSSETSLRLIMDEGVFSGVETSSSVMDPNKSSDIQISLDATTDSLSAVGAQLNSSLQTPSSFLLDTPSSALIGPSPENSLAFPSQKSEVVPSSKVTTEKAAKPKPASQNDPILLLNDHYSKKLETPPLQKNTAGTSYSERTTQDKSATVHTQKPENKMQEVNKSPPKNQSMSNFSSTDDFLQQLQSMAFPQSCSNTSQRASTSQQNNWCNNNAMYDYHCQKPSYTTSEPQTTCNQQYTTRNSTTPSKSSSPRAAQFSYSNTYEQQKTQCSEANNVKKPTTDNYSAMPVAANHKPNYPLHPFTNSGYNSNYANFFSNSTTQSSNFGSFMSGAGYNFFGGQQPYFPFNQGSANNYISGAYGNNGGSNYQNTMNQYGFSNANMNSNFSNNFSGSFSNLHFPYYNYNSYSHLYQGDGLIPHHASSLMSTFPPVTSRGTLSPRNTSTPQSINDLSSFQPSLFPVMPFVSGLQGSTTSNSSNIGSSQVGSTHQPKYSPRSVTTPKSNQKGSSKSRKSGHGSKSNPAKSKNVGAEQKSAPHDNFGSGTTIPCASSYITNTATTEREVAKSATQIYGAGDHLKSSTVDKTGQKTQYHVDHPTAASMPYSSNSNALLFHPSSNNMATKSNHSPSDFAAANSGMYNSHLNSNCNFHS